MGEIIGLFVVLIIFLIAAIFLSFGKGAFLIAGYNMMSKNEKQKYDEVALCKFVGKIMYGTSFCLLLFILSEIYQNTILLIIGIVLTIFFSIFGIIYMNTGIRFKKNEQS